MGFARVIAGAVGLLAAGILALSVLNAGIRQYWLGVVLVVPAVLPIAFSGLWFARYGQIAKERAAIGIALGVGFAVGFVSLCAGYFGPILLTPEANLGPL